MSEEDAEAREAYEFGSCRKARRKETIKAGIAAGVFVLLVILFILPLYCQGGQNRTPPCYEAPTFVTRAAEFSDSVSCVWIHQAHVSSTVVTPEVNGIIQDVQVLKAPSIRRRLLL